MLFRVERFAFTSNNITYAAMGDILAYCQFFLAEDGLGRIPAMGFGEVVQSKHPDVAVGTRCFGFYPMSRYLVIQPSNVTDTRIVDGAEQQICIVLGKLEDGHPTYQLLWLMLVQS